MSTQRILQTGDNTGSWSGYQAQYYRLWDRDYFTSALPWAQKGPSVVIPVTTSNVVVDVVNNAIQGKFRAINGAAWPASYTGAGGAASTGLATGGNGGQSIQYDPNGSLGISPSSFATAAGTINDLRTASAVQRWLEADARGGTRYIEVLKAHFNVNSSDARMQRAEYIGNTKQPIVISEVLQTRKQAQHRKET